MFVQELLKDFNPDHYGYDNLVRASEAMCRIASHINDVKKRRENAMRVQVCLCVYCVHILHVYMYVCAHNGRRGGSIHTPLKTSCHPTWNMLTT